MRRGQLEQVVAALLVLVEVVPEVHHQVRPLLGDVAVGGEEAVLELGTGGDGHP